MISPRELWLFMSIYLNRNKLRLRIYRIACTCTVLEIEENIHSSKKVVKYRISLLILPQQRHFLMHSTQFKEFNESANIIAQAPDVINLSCMVI